MTIGAVQPLGGEIITVGAVPMVRCPIGEATSVAIGRKYQALAAHVGLLDTISHPVLSIHILHPDPELLLENNGLSLALSLVGHLLLLHHESNRGIPVRTLMENDRLHITNPPRPASQVPEIWSVLAMLGLHPGMPEPEVMVMIRRMNTSYRLPIRSA